MEKTGFVIKTLIILFALSWIASMFVYSSSEKRPLGNIALIEVKGVIAADKEKTAFAETTAASSDIVWEIQDAEKDPSIKAIVFEINSPGGSPVASKEIVDAIRKAEKPTYAVIREVGASGAYWVASAADKIYANEISITGSIGVIGSYIEFAGLLEKYNMSYQRLIAGKYKDLGDPFKHMEDDEKAILQSKLDKMHDYFIKSVAENRNLPLETVKELGTGEFYLGLEALENGLIDAIGDMDTVKEELKTKFNLTEVEFVEYKAAPTFLDLLSGVISENSFFVGKGIGSALAENGNNIKIIS